MKFKYNALFFAICLVTGVYVSQVPWVSGGAPEKVLDVSLFSLNGILALYGLYRSCRPYPFSLLVAHWTFVLFFLVLAPFAQYITNKVEGVDQGVFYKLNSETSFVILIWSLIVFTCYPGGKRFSASSATCAPSVDAEYAKQANLIISLLLSVLCSIVLVALVGVRSMLFRSEGYEDVASKASPLLFSVPAIARAAVIVCSVFGALLWRRSSTLGKSLIVVIMATALFSNFPTGVARVWSGSVFLGCTCIYLKTKAKSGLWLPSALLLCFVFVMPFAGALRRMKDFGNINTSIITDTNYSEVLSSADFDALRYVG